jgi:NagD protein
MLNNSLNKKAFFIDIQGTLIDDINKKPINGAIDFINTLNKNDILYTVITNNSRYKSEIFLDLLNKKGFNIKSYLDPFYLLNDLINNKNIACFGTDDFIQIMKDLGYIIDYENPSSTVISINKDYTNEDYSNMIESTYKSDNLIGMHGTSTYSKNGKRYPGVGSIMNMIKFATNKNFKIVGKPSLNYYNRAKKQLNLDFDDITIISDDMIGDLYEAKKLGMKTILVLSGKIKSKKELSNIDYEKLDFVCEDISEVLTLLNRNII